VNALLGVMMRQVLWRAHEQPHAAPG
jgi:hypothetical protein